MATTTTRKAHGVRTIRVSDCSKLIVVVESGSVPNIEFQFGAAPADAPAPAPAAETMKVEAHAPAPAPEAAPAPAKKHGFRRKAQSAPANNAAPAPAPAPTNAAPADAPKGKGKKSFKGKDSEKPAPLCSAQRICEYMGKQSGKWNTYAVVGTGEVKKENGTWPKGTRFVQLRYIKISEEGEGLITGKAFPVKESDWATNLRNVRRYEASETLWCGCDLCCGE